MPTNKPMKMQWLTVDGRQVPSILPNHWNEQKNDWDITGTKNPLPIANYTQNASGVWLPTSESNPVPTQVTGSIVGLSSVTNNTVLASGAWLILGEFIDINYKKVRVSARWLESLNLDWRINIQHYTNRVNVPIKFFNEEFEINVGYSEEDVYGSYITVRIQNQSNEDRTIQCAELLGVL